MLRAALYIDRPEPVVSGFIKKPSVNYDSLSHTFPVFFGQVFI